MVSKWKLDHVNYPPSHLDKLVPNSTTTAPPSGALISDALIVKSIHPPILNIIQFLPSMPSISMMLM